MDLKGLDERSKKARERHNKLLRERYSFAKSLGFDPASATILSQHSKATILRLAQEREASPPRALCGEVRDD